ncbi:MAG: uroporphyrinogen decarboxylase family protein [Terrimicrobiaceae bacterium]
MTNRENILSALRRKQPEKVGFDFVLSPALLEEFKRRTGREDYQEYFGFPIRTIELDPTRLKTDYTGFYDALPAGTRPLDWNPEWGIMGAPGPTAHFQEMLHPMAKFDSASQVAQYPWPDFLADYRWENLSSRISSIKSRDLVCAAFMEMTLFEIAWYLRGMDLFMEELLCGEEMAAVLLDRLTEIRTGMASRYASAGADVLMLGDDVATQIDMMISPQLWCQELKPRLARVIAAAKAGNPDILIFYHGDGNMARIVPDLIEIGVEILNPVQPECMDPIEMKRLYGDRLAFWGGVGTQTTLPFGSPDEVRRKCRELILTVGAGGGLLLAPTHTIEPDVPWENVEAFLDSVRQQA